MNNEQLIPTQEICAYYQVALSFIRELHDHELLEIKTIEETTFVETDRLNDLERFIRLHYDMDVNLEGIEVVDHLLRQLEEVQDQVKQLKNRLMLYEG